MGKRNEQLPEGDPDACSRPDCRTRRRVVTPVPLCSRHLAQLRRARDIVQVGDALLLAEELDEDGQPIIDGIAVEMLAKGWRVVRATWTERALAASWIVEQHPDNAVSLVSERMGIDPETAYQLTEAVRAGNTAQPLSVGEGVNFQATPSQERVSS